MKTIILILTCATLSAQNVTLNNDTSYGSNCSNSQNNQAQTIEINGDLHINTFTLNLRNVNLIVNGDLLGNGSIQYCGNSNLCVMGEISNSITIESGLSQNCTLSVQNYVIQQGLPKNKFYKLYDVSGKLIQQGNTDNLIFPKNKILFLHVENYEVKTVFIKN